MTYVDETGKTRNWDGGSSDMKERQRLRTDGKWAMSNIGR